MLMAWDNWRAAQAYLLGDINRAVSHLKHANRNRSSGRNLARKLTRKLIGRAKRNINRNDFPAAWRDLTSATEIACPADQDRLSRQKSKLVELTIESADSLLTAGKISQALALVAELQSRHILDWRSDRIEKTGRLIQDADDLAARGQVNFSNEKLKMAINLRPDLALLEARQKANEHRRHQIDRLSRDLQQALLENQSDRVRQLCGEILTIAPSYQVALDAQRQWNERTSSPDRSMGNTTHKRVAAQETSTEATAIPTASRQFLIWVDQVGGFLACPGATNTIGAALPQANIQIPIVADLSRRNVKVERTACGHLVHPLTPLGTVTIDGHPVTQSSPWKSGQIMELEGRVRLRYIQPHPGSRSARLDLVSRHRTEPWSDAVLLVTDTILLGPDPRNHICCPHWSQNIVLFFQQGAWHCQCTQTFQVDSKRVRGTARLTDHSRIAGTDFSIALEPVP
ncbi:MAG: hypothetical protein MK108_04315 [Mariniblastus sp.]|nr:hypothetical protein [Mariniblastus sp.]